MRLPALATLVVVALGCAAAEAPRETPEPVASAAATGGEAAVRGPFLRVLGTAQDGGFPHAACDCERCFLARSVPELRRLVASLAIVTPERGGVHLVDAGPDLREQLDLLRDVRDVPEDRVDREPVDGIFLTHAHIGHYLGLALLGFEAVNTSALPLWATPRMTAFLSANGPWDQLVRFGNVELVELDAATPVELGGGVTVTPLWVPHRDEYTDTVGFRIAGPSRTVLYVPDSDPWDAWPTPVEEILSGVDVALLDGTFFSTHELPGRSVEEIRHPLVGDTMDRLQPLVDAGGLEVWFTHFNHTNPLLDAASEEQELLEKRGFRLLTDRLEIPL
jgi:pyrroloquinoline quinone biosynthesis protein B